MEEKKPYLHIKEVSVPMYYGTFVVVLTNSVELLKKKLPLWSDDYVFAHTVLGDWKGWRGHIVVLNFDHEVKLSYGTIAHEALHATLDICDSVNIVVDFKNQEPVTYLNGWVMDQVMSFCTEKGFHPVVKNR